MEHFEVTVPTRVDLSGGTLDLWPVQFLAQNSQTINCAVDLKVTVLFTLDPSRGPGFEVTDGTQTVSGSETGKKVPARLQFPYFLVDTFLRQFGKDFRSHLRVRWSAEAPARSGLGGSSSLAVGFAQGLCRSVGLSWRWEELLDWVRDAEAAYLKTPTGVQDYLAAIHGGICSYRFPFGKVELHRFPKSSERGLVDRLCVIFSGENHDSGPSNWKIFRAAFDGNKTILKGLQKIGTLTEAMAELLDAPSVDWKKLGKIMSQEWAVRRQSFRVQTPTLDRIVRKLQGPGVLGVKVCGAAKGGSLVALVDPFVRQKFEQRCEDLGITVLKCKVAFEGASILGSPSQPYQKLAR